MRHMLLNELMCAITLDDCLICLQQMLILKPALLDCNLSKKKCKSCSSLNVFVNIFLKSNLILKHCTY